MIGIISDTHENEDAIIKSNKYNYILTVHTHIKRDEKIGKTRVINPGDLFRIHPYTIALLDVKKDTVIFKKIQRGTLGTNNKYKKFQQQSC